MATIEAVGIKSVRALRDGKPMRCPRSPDFEKLKLMLREKGLLNPILINSRSEIVNHSEYRYFAWAELGNKHVPVEMVQEPELAHR